MGLTVGLSDFHTQSGTLLADRKGPWPWLALRWRCGTGRSTVYCSLYPHWIENPRAWQGHLELWAPTSIAGTSMFTE